MLSTTTNKDLALSSLYWQNFRGMAKAAAATRPGLVTYTGDISYADGIIGDWELFMENAAPVLGLAPVLVQQGNHERDG